MSLEDLLNDRYSCRAFRPDQVSDEVIEQMFALAQRTPSWCNTQPWQAHVTSGEATQRLAKVLTDHAASGGAISTDLEMSLVYNGVYDERRKDAGYRLYGALGIDRADRPARDAQMLKNFSFFGAPHTAVITSDRAQGTYAAIDCGGYVTTLMLAAQSLGIATVPQAAIAMYADVVREQLELPEDRVVVCAVSFGHADDEHRANAFRTTRADLADVLHRVDS